MARMSAPKHTLLLCECTNAFWLHNQSRRKCNWQIFCKHAVSANSPGAHLNFPECIGAGGRRGWLPQGCSKKNMKLALVLITGEKFLLLCMEQPDHIPLSGKDIKIKFHVQGLQVPAFGDVWYIKIMEGDHGFSIKGYACYGASISEPQPYEQEHQILESFHAFWLFCIHLMAVNCKKLTSSFVIWCFL